MRGRFFTLTLCLAIVAGCSSPDRYIALGGYAQGGVYAVKFNAKGVKVSPEALQAQVDSILNEIDFTLSGYNKASLLSRLNAGETVKPNEMLCELYDISYRYYIDSEGAMDVSSGPLFDIWGFGFKDGEMPSEEDVSEAQDRSGMDRLRPRMEDAIRADGTLTARDLLLDTLQAPPVLNFNAIAQGYSSDVIAAWLHALGVHDMLVDIGEIYCEGLNQSGKPWTVGLDRPADGNFTPGADLEGVWHSCGSGGQGIVTSGNYRKFYVRDGKKYSHSIDPRTGAPVQHNLLSATVVAPDATAADAVATWCMVIGLDDAKAVLGRLGMEGCLIYDDGGGNAIWQTPGFGLEK